MAKPVFISLRAELDDEDSMPQLVHAMKVMKVIIPNFTALGKIELVEWEIKEEDTNG